MRNPASDPGYVLTDLFPTCEEGNGKLPLSKKTFLRTTLYDKQVPKWRHHYLPSGCFTNYRHLSSSFPDRGISWYSGN